MQVVREGLLTFFKGLVASSLFVYSFHQLSVVSIFTLLSLPTAALILKLHFKFFVLLLILLKLFFHTVNFIALFMFQVFVILHVLLKFFFQAFFLMVLVFFSS